MDSQMATIQLQQEQEDQIQSIDDDNEVIYAQNNEQVNQEINKSNFQDQIDEDDANDWERTNVESIKEVRDAEIETKMFEMHKENNEMTSTLVTKEKQLQKQVRGITSECGKLRLEVGWLERDLSQVKENGRRQVLETQAALQIQRLRMEEDTRDKVKEARFLQKKLDQQRDEITQKLLVAQSQKSGTTNDLDMQIAFLSEELENITTKIVNAGTKFAEPASEARQTTSMLRNQIRQIELRGSSLDDALEKSRKHLDDLQLKLEKAEKESECIKSEIQRLAEERTVLRKKLEKNDMNKWLSRISTLSTEELENEFNFDEDADYELGSNNQNSNNNLDVDLGFQFGFDSVRHSGVSVDVNVI